MDSAEVRLRTGRRWALDVTDEVAAFTADKGDGLCHLFLPHATAGLALIELGSGTEDDLLEAVEEMLPRDRRYRHAHGSPGHGRDHVLPAFVSPSLVLAVESGHLVLGTWQRVVLIDPNLDNPDRRLLLHFLPAG
ncbi:MAG TPA: YjbQ family protein [Acidimicrobiales bacterium]|nr:YjbQ family protein [Acidimicrobiales bacterium]